MQFFKLYVMLLGVSMIVAGQKARQRCEKDCHELYKVFAADSQITNLRQ